MLGVNQIALTDGSCEGNVHPLPLWCSSCFGFLLLFFCFRDTAVVREGTASGTEPRTAWKGFEARCVYARRAPPNRASAATSVGGVFRSPLTPMSSVLRAGLEVPLDALLDATAELLPPHPIRRFVRRRLQTGKQAVPSTAA